MLIQTAKSGAERWRFFMGVVKITLSFNFFSTYTMRLIPVQVGLTQPSGSQPDQRNTFQLPPPAFSINLSQPYEVANGPAYGNSLDLRYLSNNVEVHEASLLHSHAERGTKRLSGCGMSRPERSVERSEAQSRRISSIPMHRPQSCQHREGEPRDGQVRLGPGLLESGK